MTLNSANAKHSYEVVEGDNGVVSVVRGNPSDGYDVLVVSAEAISHHERKYEAKAAARSRGGREL
jgi:hypothetical protein